MNNSSHLHLATTLFKLGYGVIPLRDNKEPIGAWKKLQTTPKSPNDMFKTNNYGLICGVNNVEVLDLDYKVLPSEEDKDKHYNTMLSFIQENIEDASNKLALYETMSGGVHFFTQAFLAVFMLIKYIKIQWLRFINQKSILSSY